jgi:starch synthase (maltosyl-transferring)
LPAEKLRVVRNGLDFVEFDAASARGTTEALPEAGKGLVVGTVGRLEEQKGTVHLLDALARMPPDLAEVRLWIVGDGPEARSLRNRAARLKLEERVQFLGVRRDVPALMARFDLFVLPSLWEGLPNVVIEAMAARRAVIATNVDGTPEAVVHGWTGLLVPPENPGALAQAMGRLLREPAMRQRFGEAGRRKAEELFGLQRMVAETEEVYREALAEARSGES